MVMTAEEKREYHREYWAKNKDKISKKRKKYYLKNKDKIAKRREKYYLKNKDKISKEKRKYYANKKPFCSYVIHRARILNKLLGTPMEQAIETIRSNDMPLSI